MAILTVLQARLHELLTMRSVQHQLLHLLSEQEVADLHVHEARYLVITPSRSRRSPTCTSTR